MTQDPHDRPNAALYRLLAEAVHGGQAKVDAMIALMQRTVFVVPWPAGADGYRTLVNSQGVAALPLFTDRDELETASRRYGWLAPDGSAPATEMGARQAFHYALTQSLAFVVVDIAADHCVEIAREEFEPLLSPAARRDSSGPFAGAGRISSTLMRSVRSGRPTPAPGTV
ncbi:MAG: SseB family protein, partial [Myxococcota bacterium]|nr:SseB family protein [Myxococcota bacterium]